MDYNKNLDSDGLSAYMDQFGGHTITKKGGRTSVQFKEVRSAKNCSEKMVHEMHGVYFQVIRPVTGKCSICETQVHAMDWFSHVESRDHLQLCPTHIQENSTAWSRIGKKPSAGVMIICSKDHAEQIVDHFGPVDTVNRHEVQAQVPIPVDKCKCHHRCGRFAWSDDGDTLCFDECPMSTHVAGCLSEELLQFGRNMRTDCDVRLRPFIQKGVVLDLKRRYNIDISRDLVDKPEQWHVVSSISMPCPPPFHSERARRTYRHIDIGITGSGKGDPEDKSTRDTARRELGEELKAVFSDGIWSEEIQQQLREDAGVSKLPLVFYWQPTGFVTYILMVPSSASVEVRDSLLSFNI